MAKLEDTNAMHFLAIVALSLLLKFLLE